MPCEVKEILHPVWGNCLRLFNGVLEAVVTTDFGPRLISLRLPQGKNVLFEDGSLSLKHTGEEMERRYGAGAVFYRRGGHFFTTAPEHFPKSYAPDNSPVVYKASHAGVVLTPPRTAPDDVTRTLELLPGTAKGREKTPAEARPAPTRLY